MLTGTHPGPDRPTVPATSARGLPSERAVELLAEHGPNAIPPASRPGLVTRLLHEVREPMTLLLLVAAGIAGGLLGETADAAAILSIVIANMVIALVQQGRAEQALDALRDLEAPSATVRRDGVRKVIPAAGLVVGDVVEVQAGDAVPADVQLLASDVLQVDESMLTGESLPASKRAGGARGDAVTVGDRDGTLHSGTLVLRGVGTGVVTATGTHTVLGSIAGQLRDVRREPTPLQRQLAGLTRWLGLAALLVAAGTFALSAAIGIDWERAFLTGVALAVAAVPEGLAPVTTVALSLGVGRMARRGAIIRRLPAVETLGAIDVLVIDKTGTLTENRMSVAGVIGGDGRIHEPEAVPGWLDAAMVPVRVLCNDADLDPPTGDPTEQALLHGIPPGDITRLREASPRLAGAPFTADRMRMSSVHRLAMQPPEDDRGDDGRSVLPGGERTVLLLKGAPEVVVPRCTTTLDEDGPAALDHAGVLECAAERGRRGERVLALAVRWLEEVPADAEVLEQDLVLVGLVALRDPPRTSATASVAATTAAGVTLVMATGDHPATAEAIADEVGIGSGRAVTGTELRTLLESAAPVTATRFARVEPEQKLGLITRLREQGHVVGMTGDGVNDAPALRHADIGVALGATGSDVAREAADMVITDDDLATLVAAVEEGRGIHDNLRKVVDFLVTSNLSEIAVVVSTLVLLPSFGVPLFPLQLLWINLLTDGLPALALGVDPHDPQLMRRPPRAMDSQLLGLAHLRTLSGRAGVLSASALGAFLLARLWLDLPTAESRTVLFSSLVLTQILYAFVISTGWRHNRWLVASAVAAMSLQLLVVVLGPAQAVFDTATPPLGGWLLIGVGGLLGPAVVIALARLRGGATDRRS